MTKVLEFKIDQELAGILDSSASRLVDLQIRRAKLAAQMQVLNVQISSICTETDEAVMRKIRENGYIGIEPQYKLGAHNDGTQMVVVYDNMN